MIGGDKTPFRLPCEGSTGVFTGSIIKQSRPAPVPAFGNTTQMLDHCGNTITASERFYQTDACGDDICAPDCDDCPGGTDLVINTPEPPKISENTFAEIGTVHLEPARKLGFKAVQAFKFWHGRHGFDVSADGTDCSTGALSNIKYRTVRVRASARTDDQS